MKRGFLRKITKEDKKKGRKSMDIKTEIEKIMQDAKKVFDDYSVLIAAFAVSQILDDLIEQKKDKSKFFNFDTYVKEKKYRVDSYLNQVVTAMKKDI